MAVSGKRVTEKEVRDYLRKHFPSIELVQYGGTIVIHSIFRCKKCGCEWDRSVYTVKRTKSKDICPMCGKYKTVRNVKKESECFK